MSIYEKLLTIQQGLNAPKSQRNDFGKYNYRSCEDILQAVKPLLRETKTVLKLSDSVVEVGGRVYVEATTSLIDTESNGVLETKAFAREEEVKKGMDTSQITGAASSYARKYALSGLFAIDDNKDSDATNVGSKQAEPKQIEPKEAPDGYYYCEQCGKQLTGTVLKDGKRIDHREVAKRVLKKYGKQLCPECCKDAVPIA